MWATSRYTNRHFSSFASLISSIEVIEFWKAQSINWYV